MGKLTHREVQTRLAWLDEQFDRPDRADYYMMQIAAEIRRWKLKDPRVVKISDMLLKSEPSRGMESDPASERRKAARQKLLILASFGVKPSPEDIAAQYEGLEKG
jgi:hypothetical protein